MVDTIRIVEIFGFKSFCPSSHCVIQQEHSKEIIAVANPLGKIDVAFGAWEAKDLKKCRPVIKTWCVCVCAYYFM